MNFAVLFQDEIGRDGGPAPRSPARGLTEESGMVAEGRLSELLTAAQLGDAGAYRLFLSVVTPFIRAIARKRTASEDMADDVVQDALRTIHCVRNTYEPGRPLRPWLAAIAERRSLDAFRRHRHKRARDLL
jgi:RNA polymerase sigma-70 factor (ECF subfamily)